MHGPSCLEQQKAGQWHDRRQQDLSSNLVIIIPGQLACQLRLFGAVVGAVICHPNLSHLDQDTHLPTVHDSSLPSAEKSLCHLLRDNTHQRPADVGTQRPGPFASIWDRPEGPLQPQSSPRVWLRPLPSLRCSSILPSANLLPRPSPCSC